ncbi:sensor histidine kinase [Pseudalkalibacillus hwajinpoensis]|uniref:sensor histidine kinase n=1 Tax=Guptibacillus hwajinpoensis TaxID=208199 RepID=UPI001CD482D5|nr:histidine kinase [Pseudalkalibacillus hwajinpoensis]MCA0991565.1 histidine kinase [Pseudalkalibacillus hwajinpoensis]
MKIQARFILFFTLLVILMNGVAFYLFHSSQRTIDDYHTSFERFIVLNEISQQTNTVYEAMNTYLTARTQTELTAYATERKILSQEKEDLLDIVKNEGNDQIVTNYENMIESFLLECDITVQAFQRQEINQYSGHLNEAAQISTFIQETTLTLINSELTDYRTFYNEMDQKSSYLQWMGISLFVSMIIFSFLMAFWFSRGITKPIHELAAAAKKLARGDFTANKVVVKSRSELQLLAETFYRMQENIQGLIIEMKQKSELDQLLKEMELKSLQSQMNPHFLFNTLNTISRRAYIEGAEQTSELIESVAALLRYNLGNLAKDVTLKDELTIVREYFFIQKSRFGERVKFDVIADENVLDCKIPVLTLQPIVENAFIHGVETYEEGGEIMIRIYAEQDDVIIEVADNGVGMETTRLSQLFSNDEHSLIGNRQGHSTGLGMQNVKKRIELFSQQAGSMTVHSSKEVGTTVRLNLPYRKQKGDEQFA